MKAEDRADLGNTKNNAIVRKRLALLLLVILIIVLAWTYPGCSFFLKLSSFDLWNGGNQGTIVVDKPVNCYSPEGFSTKVIKATTYNIHGLPWYKSSHRKKIAAILRQQNEDDLGADIMALQEAFDWDMDFIINNSGYTNAAIGPPGGVIRLRGGTAILTNHRITEINWIVFTISLPFDWFARKGILHARIEIPGLPCLVDVYTAHLFSDPDVLFLFISRKKAAEIRQQQINKIHEFIQATRGSGTPILLLADLNFPFGPEMKLFQEMTKLTNVFDNLNPKKLFAKGLLSLKAYTKTIDHHLYLDEGSEVIIKPISAKFANWGQQLSDHLPLEVHYQIATQ